MKTLNKIRDNKRIRLGLIAIALLLVSIGSTYAWWTASVNVQQKVTMGNLKIEANFKEKAFTNYEPGTYAEITGTIKNTGSIPAFVKIANASKITFAYVNDANVTANPIPEVDRVAVDVDSNVVKINYEPQSGDYENNAKVFWFQDTKGTKYLLMEPKSSIKVNINVDFDGNLTTNKYMDSVVDVKANIQATQVIEGAILSEFGIDSSALSSLSNEAQGEVMGRAAVTQTKAQDRLNALLSRGR